MSAYETNRVLARNGFAGSVTRLLAAVAAWNDARVTRNELSQLSDRQLEDIGLLRADIDNFARR